MRYFKLPDLGEGLQEAEIVEWHVNPGDDVQTDQTVVSVETAKAIVDVPAPRSGKIGRLFGGVGVTIHVGETLFEYADGTEESGALVGTANTEVTPTLSHEEDKPVSETHTGTNILATPYVKATAKSRNIDLSTVLGSGPGGQIVLQDLTIKDLNKLPLSGEPLKGARKAMAKNMSRAHSEVVKVTLNEDADLYRWKEKQATTLRVIRALREACKAEPILNSWFDSETNTIQTFEDVNLGVAVDSPHGLFVPVIPQINTKPMYVIYNALEEAKSKVRTQSLPPSAMLGATITLSNFGTLCGRYADPVVVPPCVAIIGTGKIRKEVVCQNDNSIAIHPILPLSLSFDHRVVTGGEASRFLQAFINDIERDS